LGREVTLGQNRDARVTFAYFVIFWLKRNRIDDTLFEHHETDRIGIILGKIREA
jgi:hypothetical protein